MTQKTAIDYQAVADACAEITKLGEKTSVRAIHEGCDQKCGLAVWLIFMKINQAVWALRLRGTGFGGTLLTGGSVIRASLKNLPLWGRWPQIAKEN